MSYQVSSDRYAVARRSGTTPPPTAASPWQTLQNRPKRCLPVATVAASAVAGGGLSTSFSAGGSAGSFVFPPSLHARTPLIIRRVPDGGATLPPPQQETTPPPAQH